jgi:protein gp37
MGEITGISWADATFNPWIGCTRVSPGCDNCYAGRDNDRHHWVASWDAGVLRYLTKPDYWKNPSRWNRKAARTGHRPRVFCASYADVFDNEVPDEWRANLWQVIRETPLLRWMLLTKRIGNVPKMVPPDWPMPHVGLMATLVNQEEWNRDFPKLMAVPAPWHGVSIEPMLGPVEIGSARPDWIITGGESGPRARMIDVGWVRSIRDQCARNGIAFHHKQWGGLRPKQNGCLLDGIEHNGFPPPLGVKPKREQSCFLSAS